MKFQTSPFKIAVIFALATISLQQSAAGTENRCVPGKCLYCAPTANDDSNFCAGCKNSILIGDEGQGTCQGTTSRFPFCEIEVWMDSEKPFCFRCSPGYWPIKRTKDSDPECQKEIVCSSGEWNTSLNAFSCAYCPNGMKLANENGVGGCVEGGVSIEGCLTLRKLAGGEYKCDICGDGYYTGENTCKKISDGQNPACSSFKSGSFDTCEECNWNGGYFGVGTNADGSQICQKFEGVGEENNGGQGGQGGGQDPSHGGDKDDHGHRGGKKSNSSILTARFTAIVLVLFYSVLNF